MNRLRYGDEEAAWELIDVYGPHILRVVRRDLNRRLRSRFDSADFVQAVWASFFRQPSQFRRLESPDDLLRLLLTVARNKVIDETRYRLNTRKQDVGREADPDFELDLDELPSKTPRPSQVAVAREQWRRLLDAQPRVNRTVLEMRFAGASYEEIAAKLKIHERSVRKIVEELLAHLDG
jgi:RNA polymerase sigma factor (sigma-70 family)